MHIFGGYECPRGQKVPILYILYIYNNFKSIVELIEIEYFLKNYKVLIVFYFYKET